MIRNLLAACVLMLAACNTTATVPPTTGPVASLPGAAPVCTALNSDKFDLALKAYGAATDAVNLLVDAKVLVPGTARAVAIANANDRVLAAFGVAEQARRTCNSATYLLALNEARAGLDQLRLALKGN